MKRILFLLLLVFTILPTHASYFAVDVNGTRFYFNKLSGGKSVEVTYGNYSGEVVIPESVTYDGTTYTVTSIGESAFKHCSGLSSVTIPNSVTSIGKEAFYESHSLTSVTIGNSVTSIGDEAFSGCTGLTSLTIPNSVTSIGNYAFYYTDLKNFTIEDGESMLSLPFPLYPFSKCTIENLYIGRDLDGWISLESSSCIDLSNNLKTVTLGGFVTSIVPSAFSGCTSLTSVTIGNSVTSIGNCAFMGCSGLTSVDIPNSVTSIGRQAFYGCTGLTSVTIGNSVTSIGDDTFYGCTGLTSMTIPNSVTSIGDYAFSGCSNLTSVTIPNSVTSIGYKAFYGCSGLTSVTIPNSVTSIGGGAFRGCVGLTSVTIGNSVTSIGDYTFYGCTGLTSMTIGNSVTSIGKYAFEECRGLTSVTIPISVTSIGDYAFSNCNYLDVNLFDNQLSTYSTSFSNIRTLVVGSKVTVSGTSKGSGIDKVVWLPNTTPQIRGNVTYVSSGSDGTKLGYLSSMFKVDGFTFVPVSPSERTCMVIDYDYQDEECEVTIPEKVAYRGIEFSVVNFGDYMMSRQNNMTGVAFTAPVTAIPTAFAKNCTSLAYFNIPESVTAVNDLAFVGCTTLGSVTIPESVTSIGASAYKDCTALESLIIGNSVKTIDESAFENCSALASVAIPNSVTAISKSAFKNCSTLNPLTIGNSVTSIGESAFENCAAISSINIPVSVRTINKYAFRGCTGLSSLTLPNSDIALGESSFEGCTGLAELTIPTSLTTVPASGFSNCTGLTSLTLGRSVASIGNYAFSGCSGLTTLTIPASVTAIGGGAFSGCSALESVKFNASTCNNSSSSAIFSDCPNISEFVFGYNVQKVPANLCNGLNLESLEIPSSVTSIGSNAFTNCDIADFVLVDSENSISISSSPFSGCDFENVRIGRKISDANIFAGKTSIKTAWITDIPTSVAEGLFRNCSGLELVYVGDNVTSIGNRAFSGCSSLKYFQYGKNLNSIGAEAFSDCSGITNIYAEPLTPPSVGEQALDDLDHWNCTIHVPAEAMAAYQAAPQWKEFFFYDNDFSVALNEESLTLDSGEVFQLEAMVTSSHASRAAGEIRWVTTNPNVAVVDGVGHIVAVGNGKCSIAAFNSDNVMANCMINIDSETDGQVKLDRNLLSLDIMDIYRFKPNVKATDLTWTSSDPKVASIDDDGFLTALSTGTTIIRACNAAGAAAACIVNVSNEYSDIEEIEVGATVNEMLFDIYTLQGICIKRGATKADVNALTPGIYIVGGKKMLVK